MGQIFLNTPPVYGTAGSPQGIATGDFNGDGNPDVVTANYGGTISVLLGNGDGTFLAHTDSVTGQGDVALGTGDFNGDDKLDLATTNYISDTISVLLGNGDGTFQPEETVVSGGSSFFILTTDFNHDGFTDIAYTDQNLNVLISNGDGTFDPATVISIPGGPTGLAAADLNGDGKVDLALATNFGNAAVLLGNGDGTFQPYQQYSAGIYGNGIAAGDLNGDGKLDLVTANGNLVGTSSVSVLLGNGDGTFQGYQQYTVPIPISVALADLNNDGKLDLVTDASTQGGVVGVLLGNGDGSFQPFTTYLPGSVPYGLTVADFNHDGNIDIATANTEGNVGVLLGNGSGNFPVLTGYPTGNFPESGAVADFNRDGRPDLVIANYFDVSTSVFLQGSDGNFQARIDFQGQNGQVGAADVNGDGNADFVVDDYSSGTCEVATFLGNGDGTFRSKVDSSACPFAYTFADFNRDGKLDIAGSQVGGVSVALGNGDGTFAQPQIFSSGGVSSLITVGDFSGDGVPDIATPNYASGSGTLGVLLGNGDGTFQPPVLYAIPRGSSGIVSGDLNGDQRLDLVILSTGLGGYTVMLGNGDGTFQPAMFTFALGLETLVLGDVNGDGYLDLLCAGGNIKAALRAFLGNGKGTFQAEVDYTTPLEPNFALLADFNLDGSPDVAIVNGIPVNTVGVMYNLRGTALRTTSSPNPSRVGEAVTFVVAVTPTFPGHGTPSGAVTLKDGSRTLATIQLRQGRAHWITSGLRKGKHKITTSYSGDSNFNPNSGPVIVQVVN